MKNDQLAQQRLYLKPGKLCISNKPVTVQTVLGSCVSLTVFDPANKRGAISHAMLPGGIGAKDFRYVDCSLLYMLKRMTEQGVPRKKLIIKLFGGASVMASFQRSTAQQKTPSVGAQNLKSVYLFLQQHSLHLAAQDVGGEQGRKLFFAANTGEIWLSKIDKTM